jgi:agmatine/peptidylarginine deiminase
MNTSKKLPAEWEKQSFLQLTFPHQESDWAYLLDEVNACFVEIAETASRFQDVLVVCDNVERVKSYFKLTQNIYFIQAESNDTWARDHGGITILENANAVIHDYIFNGWGNKFDAGLDNQITKNLYEKGVFENCNLKTFDLVLEGGSIESDGKGTILTTSECLLSKNRNEHLSKQQIEQHLKENFGAYRVLWLNHGYLAGDDTDSHIDTLARFCNDKTIAYAGCENPDDEHFEALRQMKKELQQFRDFEGNPYKMVEVPLPDACFDSDGNRLPATYANFTIINGALLVPVYGVSQDEEALKILQSCFSDRKVIGVNCRVLIEQHGSLHCVTMQYPEKVKLNKKILS